ncbi:MAG: NADAR family protein [Treponema sp.]|jgi:ribA/ribD-fused uncharacterized protein|nr:NADAR family protein [Treponema sp.]
MDKIKFYNEGEENGFLSNFFMADMVVDTIRYPSVEHYYQSQKTEDPKQAEAIRTAPSCDEAKKLGNRPELRLRADWDARKAAVMAEALRAKFTQNPELREKLLATGEAVLMENSPRDYFWGIGADGSGKNMLGNLLAALRDSFKNKNTGGNL